ncbi:hypothetical protein HYS30_02230 [Candidatus Peregrinibacteria bacterium]|nr:hypothetical protein [Candidatus Peregrinibacteria bacterium]MBI2524333.1 hypothetical protein [Candidatus Peregrinibacteria bacterium]
MIPIHTELAGGRWRTFSLAMQLANVGSEVGRACSASAAGEEKKKERCLDRALELLDLTIADPKHRKRLKEICRLREVICDYFFGENTFHSTPSLFESYFTYFAIAARR